jgi:hypothetical protein
VKETARRKRVGETDGQRERNGRSDMQITLDDSSVYTNTSRSTDKSNRKDSKREKVKQRVKDSVRYLQSGLGTEAKGI